MQRLGKVDFRFDAVTRKICPQIVATCSPYDEQMMQVGGRRDATRGLRKPLHVEICDPAAFGDPIIQMSKLNAQDRGLYFIHP